MEVLSYSIITWEADTGEFLQVWDQSQLQAWVVDQPGIQCKTFYQNIKLKKIKKIWREKKDNVFILLEEKQRSHDFGEENSNTYFSSS